MPTDPNSYSRRWFEFFHVGIDEARTIQEVEFVGRVAPLPEFQRVLDLCCGMGRHARALSKAGYSVVGVDRDADVITQARDLGGGPDYVVGDVRSYQPAPEAFDAVMVMGQSFGHFDSGTNRDILRRLADAVRKRGRVILDLWNPEFFIAHQGERELQTSSGTVREGKRVDGDQLFVELGYPDGAEEKFEWQLFTPEQMTQFANSVGLTLLISCSNFDATTLPSPANPRIQFLLEAT